MVCVWFLCSDLYLASFMWCLCFFLNLLSGGDPYWTVFCDLCFSSLMWCYVLDCFMLSLCDILNVVSVCVVICVGQFLYCLCVILSL